MSVTTERTTLATIFLTRSFYWAVMSYGFIWVGGAAMVFSYGRIMGTSASLSKVLALAVSIAFFLLGQRSLSKWKKTRAKNK